MAYGRSKMLLNSDVMRSATPPLRRVERNPMERSPTDARRELEVLRTTNANLVRELAALKAREAQAQQLADRDALTGLYSRRQNSDDRGDAHSGASAHRRFRMPLRRR